MNKINDMQAQISLPCCHLKLGSSEDIVPPKLFFILFFGYQEYTKGAQDDHQVQTMHQLYSDAVLNNSHDCLNQYK